MNTNKELLNSKYIQQTSKMTIIIRFKQNNNYNSIYTL